MHLSRPPTQASLDSDHKTYRRTTKLLRTSKNLDKRGFRVDEEGL